MKSANTILLLTNNFPPIRGGSAVVYDSLARHLHGRLVVVAPSVSYVDGLPLIGWREHDRQAPYRVVRLPFLRTLIEDGERRGWRNRLLFLASDIMIRLRVTAVIARLVLAGQVRTVCVGELLASGWVLRLCRRLRFLRTIVYVHGEEITTEDVYDRGHQRARDALLAADRIVVVSSFTLSAVQALLGPDAMAKDISLIENGVDTGRFRPLGKRLDLVGLYNLHGAFVFVSVCRLLEKKGIDNAIQAFAGILHRHPECRYLVVGTGPHEAELRQIASAAGVTDSVIFAGDISDDDLVHHYCLGDVFLMPNRQLANGDTEGFGLVFLEANGCGLPVIAGQDGGSRDAVRDGVNGLVVDGLSVEAIRAAMLSLMEDGRLRDRLRLGAADTAASSDWSGKAASFLRMCDRP